VIKIPNNKFQLFWYKIVVSSVFETLIMLCILLNIFSMAIIYDGMSESYERMIDYINLIFSGIFFVEAVMKLTAFGFKNYFAIGWN